MPITYFNTPEDFLNKVSKHIMQTDVVLDIGCGINPQKYIQSVVHICAEPYEQYAQHLLQKIGNKGNFFVILKQRWNDILDILPTNGVYTVIALDVTEHLNKDEGISVLKRNILLVRKQVVIFTPYGFLPQEVSEGMKDGWGLDGSEWQKYKSGWIESDFNESWDIFICKEFHFFDVITKEKFKKPYGAMFAILNKNIESRINIYSIIRNIKYFFSISKFRNNSLILKLIQITKRIGIYGFLFPLWRKLINN